MKRTGGSRLSATLTPTRDTLSVLTSCDWRVIAALFAQQIQRMCFVNKVRLGELNLHFFRGRSQTSTHLSSLQCATTGSATNSRIWDVSTISASSLKRATLRSHAVRHGSPDWKTSESDKLKLCRRSENFRLYYLVRTQFCYSGKPEHVRVLNSIASMSMSNGSH